jgi:hypothetical protein
VGSECQIHFTRELSFHALNQTGNFMSKLEAVLALNANPGPHEAMSCKAAGVAFEPFQVGESPRSRNAIAKTCGCDIVIQRIFPMQRPFVKPLLAATVLGFAILQGAAALAAELPAFEVSSLPATPLQVAVLGGAGVQEQATAPTLTRNGMPASPHQLSVLTPRHNTTASVTSATTVGTASTN